MSTAKVTTQRQITQDVQRLRGRFAGRAARPVSVRDMADAVVAEAAARRAPTLKRKPRSR